MAVAERRVPRAGVCEIRLELALDSDPIAGTLSAEDEIPVNFVGWLGLTAELERLRLARGGFARVRGDVRERLTATERRVADLVCEGLTNPQVAERLGVSRRTIQGHLVNVFKKLRVSSRTELAARLLRADVVRGPDKDPAAGAQETRNGPSGLEERRSGSSNKDTSQPRGGRDASKEE